MNYRLIGKYIGFILLVEGIFLLPAIVVSAAYREPQSARRASHPSARRSALLYSEPPLDFNE